MLGKADFARLFDYTVWANHRVMRAAALLTPDDFRRDMGSSHGGVRGTLTHMMSSEWIWLERFKGLSPRQHFDEGQFPDVIALRERWVAIEQHRAVWLSGLRKGDAAAVVKYQNMEGQPFEAPLWELVQHVVNHSSYHRGQVVALLRLQGSRGVGSDLVLWDRERAAKRRRRRAKAEPA